MCAWDAGRVSSPVPSVSFVHRSTNVDPFCWSRETVSITEPKATCPPGLPRREETPSRAPSPLELTRGSKFRSSRERRTSGAA
eukprot:scaffold1454_cov342-Pavlova_lutheri.AAC.15